MEKLSKMNSGEKCRVIAVENDSEIRVRLNDLGVVSGSLIEVLTGSKDSNFLVGIGNTRIGLEYKLAEAITVQRI